MGLPTVLCSPVLFKGASDFSPLANEVLTIPSTTAVGNSVCRGITVTDDMIVEDSEIFTVAVEISNPSNVVLELNTAVVAITDDDSKLNN